MDIRRYSMLMLAALWVASPGCTSTPLSRLLKPKSGSHLTHKPSQPGVADPRYDNLIREMEAQNGQATFAVKQKSTAGQIGGAIKKATATVGSALTIKPRVTKAPDPLALNNMPRDLGIDIYYQGGRLAEANGNPATAIQQYERGLKENPKHVPTLMSLARLHDRQGAVDKAEKLYRKALEVEPDNAMVHNDLGLCLARHDRTEDALVALRQAVKLEPNRKLYRNNLATVLVEHDRVNEAWTELSAVHAKAAAHYNLGYLLYHAGNLPRAREEFTKAHEQDTSLLAARQMLDVLDAESPKRGDTAVAKAATKVQVRIEDLAPEPPGSTTRVSAQPVAAVLSPPELRRIPPPATSPLAEPVPNSSVPDADPLPLDPADPDAFPNEHWEPDFATPPAVGQPIRTLSGTIVDDGDESDLPLPTPESLWSTPSGNTDAPPRELP